MNKFQDLLQFLILLHLIGCQSITSQMCYPTESAFVKDCASQYEGIVNGGRCFYIGSNTQTNWNNSWTSCAEQGGTLAQIHTTNEWIDIFNISTICNTSCTGTWAALMRDPKAQLNQSGLVLNIHNYTFWYDENVQKNSKLSSTNTWIGGYELDDGFNQGQNCFAIYSGGVNDQPCSNNYQTLCVVHNQMQNFSLVPNICMTEPVVQSCLNTNSTNDCAQECASYSNWCRSYNYYPSSNKCDLFSWYHLDTTNYAFVIADCFHYAYIPHSSTNLTAPVCTLHALPLLTTGNTFLIPPPALRWYITAPGQLNAGECLTSQNQDYTACLLTNGNFVVSNRTHPMWSTNTDSSVGPAYLLHMQCDNDLCLDPATGNPLWCSNTNEIGPAPATMVMQNDGNFVVYGANGIWLWSIKYGVNSDPGK